MVSALPKNQLGLWTGLNVRSTVWGLNLACCMESAPMSSELLDLQKGPQGPDEGDD
jgi:hypothetical protein